jgi:hypothetical protein
MRCQVESLIKKEIQYIFGRQIVSSRDCIQLSDEIFKRTKVQLNPNTLRRFFGLVKAEYPPSQSTLTILSKYCGFQSVDEVNAVRKDVSYDSKEIDDSKEDNVLHFLCSLFKDVSVTDAEDKTFLSVVMKTVNFLNRNPALTDKFQIQIAKTKNGQEFYFEKFVNIDKLNAYYGKGLRYYYSEKASVNAQVFAHSLLVYRYWLTENKDMLDHHFKVLSGKIPEPSITPFIYARYLSAQIYHAHANQLPADKIIMDAYKYYSSIKDHSPSSFPRFELYLMEALILTGHFEEGFYYVEQVKKRYREENDYTHWKFYQNFLLFETVALCCAKNYKEANDVFEKITPDEFYFLRKSFSNIVYLYLVEKLKRYTPKHAEQFNSLIEETGFSRLRKIF